MTQGFDRAAARKAAIVRARLAEEVRLA